MVMVLKVEVAVDHEDEEVAAAVQMASTDPVVVAVAALRYDD